MADGYAVDVEAAAADQADHAMRTPRSFRVQYYYRVFVAAITHLLLMLFDELRNRRPGGTIGNTFSSVPP
jgi:hypothetical protein